MIRRVLRKCKRIVKRGLAVIAMIARALARVLKKCARLAISLPKRIVGGGIRRTLSLCRRVENRLCWKLLWFCRKYDIGKRIALSPEDCLCLGVAGGELMRLDTAVRYLAVECYFGKNDFGFDIYKKMQENRIGNGEKSVAKFRELIASYQKAGYDSSSRICLGKNLGLFDGGHRTALGLYYGLRSVSAVVALVSVKPRVSDFSKDWFLAKGFAGDEIDAICGKASELLQEHNPPFCCVIWSPAADLSEEIVRDLSRYGKVESVKRYRYGSFEEYAHVVRAIYKIDDIATWKVDKKLAHMKGFSPEIVAVALRMENPAFEQRECRQCRCLQP